MSDTPGLLIEAEEFGQLALFGLLLIPASLWVARSKTGTKMALRAVLVGVALVGVAVLEGTLDSTANKAADAVTGS